MPTPVNSLLLMVTAVLGQEERPVWYLNSSLSGTFSERSARCEKMFESRRSEASYGRILIPANTPADICIKFPKITQETGAVLEGGWRHDRGTKGGCANGCCEYGQRIKRFKTGNLSPGSNHRSPI